MTHEMQHMQPNQTLCCFIHKRNFLPCTKGEDIYVVRVNETFFVSLVLYVVQMVIQKQKKF